MAGQQAMSEVRKREAQAVSMHLAGATFQEIVDANVGYKSVSGAYDAVMRCLKRDISTDVAEIRRSELGRIDSLMKTLYPKAKQGDMAAVRECVRLMDRRSRYLGLDFLDGVAERHVEVAEQQVKLAAELVRRILGDDELELTAEQKAKVPAVAKRHLSSVA